MVWIVLSTLTTAWAQSPLALVKPPGSDVWGYADASGKMVIPAQYRKAGSFQDGFAPIYIKAQRSNVFLDPNGKFLEVEPKPLLLKSVMGFGTFGFKEGRAPFEVKKKWGYLGTDGKIVVQPKYMWVSRYFGGLASAKIDKTTYVVLDKSGKETPVTAGNLLELRRFQEGLAPFKSASKQFGFINKSGAEAIKAQFKAVGYFSEGMAWAKTADNMVGFIDTEGAWKIKPIYVAAKAFNGGVAKVKKGETWMLLTTSGAEIAVDADSFKSCTDGLCRAKKNAMHGFIDTKGTWVIEPQFEMTRKFRNGYAGAKKNGQWGFIDTEGQWVVEPSFDGVKDLVPTK